MVFVCPRPTSKWNCRYPASSTSALRPGATTLPARKLLDLCRALPDGTLLTIDTSGDRAAIRAGRSRFSLSTLPAAEFPGIDVTGDELALELSQRDLRRAIEATHFAMAQQDVRYYLNGMLFEINAGKVRLVATDGHRMAVTELPLDVAPGTEPAHHRAAQDRHRGAAAC